MSPLDSSVGYTEKSRAASRNTVKKMGEQPHPTWEAQCEHWKKRFKKGKCGLCDLCLSRTVCSVGVIRI